MADVIIDDETFELLQRVAEADDDASELARIAQLDPQEFAEFLAETGEQDLPHAQAILAAAEANVRSHSKGLSNFGWFLIGCGIGASVALLSAPAGRETRDAIRRRALDARQRLERSGREAMERGRELHERGKDLAEEASQRLAEGKEAASELHERGRAWAEEARRREKRP